MLFSEGNNLWWGGGGIFPGREEWKTLPKLLIPLFSSFFSDLPPPLPPFHSTCWHVFLGECVTFNKLLYLKTWWFDGPTLLSLGTLVPEAPCWMFYQTMCQQFYCRFDTDNMVSASTLIQYHTQKQIHT